MKRTIAIIGIMALMAFTPQEPKTYKLEFTAEEVQTIYDALGELPAKKAEVIRFKLVQQVNEQNKQIDKK
jgi:hypothetical protein